MNTEGKTERSSERVLMAMSGGVDSSVAAQLLCECGYDVVGTTLKLFGNEDAQPEEESTCCSTRDAEDARQVAFDLGIEHFVFNFTGVFGREVIDRFCAGYLGGETPNPCIDCNRYVKFGALQRRRRELGFDYVATGHYARRCFDERTGRFLLKTGLDASKDQSYVLFHLSQDDLAHMLFPLGELTKPQVRDLARDAGFITAQKSESQDICFVPDGDYASFIERRCGESFGAGPIVDMRGRVIGEHGGIDRYTIGQRKGIGVAAPEPLYVFSKDVATNALVVGTDAETLVDHVIVDDVNLISCSSVKGRMPVSAKTHYRMKAQPGHIEWREDNKVDLVFDQPQRACAPGQAAVFYDGDVVVGGGTIVSSFLGDGASDKGVAR